MADSNGTLNPADARRVAHVDVKSNPITTTVTSVATGGVVTLQTGKLPGDLLPKLTDGPINVSFRVELTWEEMSVIKQLGTATPAPAKSTADNTAATVSAGLEHRAVMANIVPGKEGTLQEARIKGLESVSTSKQGMNMLIYDIPSSLSDECPNPSNRLWHVGFRLNLSCWVIPDNGLSSPVVQRLLNHWKQYPAVEVHIIPYHDRALEQIREIARTKLIAEIRRVHESLIKRLADAAQRHTEANAEMDRQEQSNEYVGRRAREQAEIRLHGSIRSTIRDAADHLLAAVDCARVFEETESTKDLLEGLRLAIRSEAASFNALARARGISPVRITV